MGMLEGKLFDSRWNASVWWDELPRTIYWNACFGKDSSMS